MALLGRQVASTFVSFDDQGPGLWGNYVGNWTRYTRGGFFNSTFTATPTPESSVSLKFLGSQLWIYGGVVNNSDGSTSGYPTAEYIIDGVSSGIQMPSMSQDTLVYFKTGILPDGPHSLEISVTMANDTVLFILDEIEIIYNSTVTTPTMTPTAQSKSTPVGAIVGGVVGGAAVIVILVIGVLHFMSRRTRGSRDDHFEKPSLRLTEAFPGEYHTEPFNFTAPDPQSVYPGGSPNQPLNPSRGQTGVPPTYRPNYTLVL